MQQKPHVGIRLADHNTHCQIRRGKYFQHLKLKKKMITKIRKEG